MLGASVKDDPGAAANRTPWLTRSSKSTAEAVDLRPGYWKRGGQLGDGGRRAGGSRKQNLKGRVGRSLQLPVTEWVDQSPPPPPEQAEGWTDVEAGQIDVEAVPGHCMEAGLENSMEAG